MDLYVTGHFHWSGWIYVISGVCSSGWPDKNLNNVGHYMSVLFVPATLIGTVDF